MNGNTKGKLTKEDKVIHERWTEYCVALYNYKLKYYANILKKKHNIESQETGEVSLL